MPPELGDRRKALYLREGISASAGLESAFALIEAEGRGGVTVVLVVVVVLLALVRGRVSAGAE